MQLVFWFLLGWMRALLPLLSHALRRFGSVVFLQHGTVLPGLTPNSKGGSMVVIAIVLLIAGFIISTQERDT